VFTPFRSGSRCNSWALWRGVWLSLLLVVTGCRSVRPPEAPPAASFRLLTWNVNWGMPESEQAVDLIAKSGADVVCLQETDENWEWLLREELAQAYPTMHFRHAEARHAGGFAFLSRLPATEVAYVPPDTGWFGAWIMAFATPAGTVQVLNVHLRPPASDAGGFTLWSLLTTGDDRRREIERFFARRQPDVPLIVAGDFNSGDGGSALDWLRDQGLTDALSEFDRKSPTWQDKWGGITLKKRLDHVAYSPELRCHDARVLEPAGSDHRAVMAVFSRR